MQIYLRLLTKRLRAKTNTHVYPIRTTNGHATPSQWNVEGWIKFAAPISHWEQIVAIITVQPMICKLRHEKRHVLKGAGAKLWRICQCSDVSTLLPPIVITIQYTIYNSTTNVKNWDGVKPSHTASNVAPFYYSSILLAIGLSLLLFSVPFHFIGLSLTRCKQKLSSCLYLKLSNINLPTPLNL